MEIDNIREPVRSLLSFPLTEIREQQYPRYKTLRQSQWNSSGEVEVNQKRRLRRLLLHAHRSVPYYESLLSNYNVVDSGDVHIENFTDLPLLEKSDIRNHFDHLKSNDIDTRDWYENTSGGSTGEPVRFIQDTTYEEWNEAIKKVFNDWTGYKHIGPEIKLWGSEDDIFDESTTTETVSLSLRDRTRALTGWRHVQNAFHMSEEDMIRFVDEINHIRPVQIKAYTESIFQFAEFIQREDLDIYSPATILVTSGNLQSYMRQTIEDIFQTEVFDLYGSREVGAVAAECSEHEGLHVAAPAHYVEIVDDDGNPVDSGETGEIVITPLTNYAMPLVRYRIGDLAAWSEAECSCGRSWPLLGKITGRVSDTFVAKDGTQVHGEYFTHLFYFKDWVQKFQVVQEEYDYIRISIVPVEYTTKTNHHQMYREDLNEVTEDIRKVMDKECEVVFEFVNEIPPTDSGKYRYTISKVTT